VFVDYMEKNIKAAEEVGMKGILFKNIDQLKKDLESLGI
jgi:FMN phosphatase YigB (HAD superfamily)